MDPGSRPARLADRMLARPRLLGVLLAALAFVQSTAPTLMVRQWYFQGAVSGVAVALAYGIGSGVTRLVELGATASGRDLPRLATRRELQVRLVLAALLVVMLLLASVRAVRAHRWTWTRLGHDPAGVWVMFGGVLLVTALVAALLIGTAWALGWLWRRLTNAGDVVLPRWVAGVLATVLVAWVAVTALNDWVYQRTLDGLNEGFTLADQQVEDGMRPPTSGLVSGGPDSQVPWEEMGDQGRVFVDRTPTVTDLAPWQQLGTSTPEAIAPVRVFVGRESARVAADRAALALAEMERFGAFERAVVLVVVPTGTGWVNQQIVQPVEYLYGGDVATVSMQYSHLPSPLAFLTEAEAARRAGHELIGAVRARIDELPRAEQPLLLVAGESLGSFGASAAYDDLDHLVASTDASLWVGPPATVHLRREAERNRTPGSLQIRPELGDGSRVLFANRTADIVGHPRAIFLQHADDAIVWWDWPDAWTKPDWLDEPLDPAVNPRMTWYPGSTFLNLAVDMAVANAFEEDQGHKYGTQPLQAWVAMLRPPGWDTERVEELRAHLARLPR